jgi:autotransporter-associated beta strand protein
LRLTDLDSVGELSLGVRALELSAPTGGIQLGAAGGIRAQRVNAGGSGSILRLDAGSNPLVLTQPAGSSQVISAGGNVELVGSDITWAGTNSATGTVTLTASGSLQVDAADFSLTAGSVAWQSTGLQTVKGTIAATNSISFVSTDSDLLMSAALTGRSGVNPAELTFRAGRDMNLTAGSFGSVQNRLTIAAGREFALSVTPASWQVTGPSGELSVSTGGNLTISRYDVLRAAQSVTLVSTGYDGNSGTRAGGNLTVLSQPLGVGTSVTRQLRLEAGKFLHLHEKLTAGETLTVKAGSAKISEYSLLKNRGPLLLAEGADTPQLLNLLQNSVASLSMPQLRLSGGTLLEIDQHVDSGDQLAAVSSVVLSGGSVVIDVRPGPIRDGIVEPVRPQVTPATMLTGVLSGTGGFTKRGTGTLELTAANTYSGATLIQEGVLTISGSTAAESSIVVEGGRLQGSGRIQGPVTITSAGILSPGNSPGILQTGSLTVASGAEVQIDLAGTTAGSGYDQLSVTGGVSIDGSRLSLSYGTFTASAGNEFLILLNDGNDAISGRFLGLPDGALVTSDFAGSGLKARISYYAGDGNDISLIIDEAQPQVVVPNNGQTSDVQLRVVEETIQVVLNGEVKRTVAVDGINGLTLSGNAGVNDSMRLNFTGENMVLLSAVDLIGVNLGGDANDDLIVLVDGIDVTVQFTTAQNGLIMVESVSIPFTGLGQNTLTIQGAQNLNLSFSSDSTDIVFTADATTGFTQVTGTNVSTTQFVNPTGSLVVNLGPSSSATFTSMDPGFNPVGGVQINGGSGDNVITFTSLGSNFTGTLNVNGGAGTDTVIFNGTLQAASLDVQSELVRFAGASLTTFGGPMLFTGDVTLATNDTTLNSSGGTIAFQGSVTGNQNLVLASGIGSGTTTFMGSVSNLGSGSGPALTVQNGVTGLVRFQSSVTANSGFVANSSTSNIRFDGDVTLGDGNTGTTLAGNVQLDGLAWSSFDGVSLGTVTLSGAAVSLNSNSFATAFNGPVNGGQDLTLTAGTGNIDFNAAVGSSTRLGALTIVSAARVTIDALLQATSITQLAGSGTTTFTGAVNTNAAAGVAVTGTNLALNGGLTTTGGGGLTANLSGTAAVAGSTTQSIGGAASITASGSITVGTSAVVSAAGAVLLKSSGNSITLQADAQLTAAAGNVVLEAEDSLLLGSGSVVTATLADLILRSGLDSTDNIGGMTLDGTLRALSPGQSITLDLNDEQGATQNATTCAIQATSLRLRSNTTVTASFSLLGAAGNDLDLLAAETSGAVTFRDRDDLTIGSITASSGIPTMAGISTVNGISEGAAISIIVSGALAANQPFRTSPTGGPGGSNSGTVTLQSLTSTLSLTDDADITADGPVSLTAATGISTAAEITTSSDNITFASAVTLTAAVELSTGAATGNILFSQTVNGPGDLTLTAGTGTIDFAAAVGSGTRLGAVTIISGWRTSPSTPCCGLPASRNRPAVVRPPSLVLSIPMQPVESLSPARIWHSMAE